MKPDYKNWVPKGMVIGIFAGVAAALIAFAVFAFSDILSGTPKTITSVILGIAFIVLILWALAFLNLYRTFSYNGKKQFARRIIDKISDFIVLPEGGCGLDIGCGSGALTIACAKKNKQGRMVGLDRWGKEYASFNMPLCEKNAEIEGVSSNTEFVKGDACKLDFPDETFDAVTSNYCYHNIPSRDRQSIILETLRVLKKGGTFAIHDEFSESKYGDMDKLVDKLIEMGYERVELIDTTKGRFMSGKEAGKLFLKGSALLTGKK